jgi:hypothetical protein
MGTGIWNSCALEMIIKNNGKQIGWWNKAESAQLQMNQGVVELIFRYFKYVFLMEI